MNLYKKGSIFLTFFGSCLALGLVVAALGTKWWVVAKAKRISNPEDSKSNGTINMGLFEGEKRLNPGYGWRDYPFQVTKLVYTDREFLLYGVWVATIGCLSIGLLFSVLSAIFAVLNTATNQYLAITGLPGLYMWNALACAMHLTALILWGVQFTQKLQHNVMTTTEITKERWTSDNMAYLGLSYWFVLGAVVVHIVNILIICIGTREPKSIETVDHIVEEKTRGAIMLY